MRALLFALSLADGCDSGSGLVSDIIDDVAVAVAASQMAGSCGAGGKRTSGLHGREACDGGVARRSVVANPQPPLLSKPAQTDRIPSPLSR
jgi:hypothetical protein